MRSLGVRLALAFLAVIIVSVGGVALLVGRETAQEFQSYVDRGRLLYLERVANGLTHYYQVRGDWAGVEPFLQGWSRGPFERLALADASGTVIADTADRAEGRDAVEAGLGPGTPLVVNGQRIGTLYVTVAGPLMRRAQRALALEASEGGRYRMRAATPMPDAPERADAEPDRPRRERADEPAGDAGSRGPFLGPLALVLPSPPAALPSPEVRFLERVNHAIALSALAAAALAGLLSLLFARQLAHPLRELATGARRLAAGDLRYRAPVRGHDEVAALAVAFNDMAASLERLEQARRNLVADVAHELRTPLTVIEGTVEAMLDGVYPADQERLASIREEVALLTKLVADLRELSLAEAGGLRLETEPIEPAVLVRRAVAAAGARAEAREITLVADVAEGLPLVPVDATRIAQVLANLLDNALRYSPPGGTIVVGASLAPPRSPGARTEHDGGLLARLRHAAGAAHARHTGTTGVRDAAGPASDERRPAGPPIESRPGVRFWVADEGPGITPADLPYIFERFYRADPSRARRSGGSGLGLAIARRYVEAHGGRIWAESPNGAAAGSQQRGTTVAFWLPAITAPAAAAAGARAATRLASPVRSETGST
jgi:two-component system OmpR family sensor kinase/two-component system sensor histidine kinase BaeS